MTNNLKTTLSPIGVALFTRNQEMANDYQWLRKVGNPVHFNFACKIHQDLLADTGGIETGYAIWTATNGNCMILVSDMPTNRSDAIGRPIYNTLFLEFEIELRSHVMDLAAILAFGDSVKKSIINVLSSYCDSLLKNENTLIPLEIVIPSLSSEEPINYLLKTGYWALPCSKITSNEISSFFKVKKNEESVFFLVFTGRVDLNKIKLFYKEAQKDFSMLTTLNSAYIVSSSSTLSNPVKINSNSDKGNSNKSKSSQDSTIKTICAVGGALVFVGMLATLPLIQKWTSKPPCIKSWKIKSVSPINDPVFCKGNFINQTNPVSRFLEDVYPYEIEITRKVKINLIVTFTKHMNTNIIPQLQYDVTKIRRCDPAWNPDNPMELIVQISFYSGIPEKDLIATIDISNAYDKYDIKMNVKQILIKIKESGNKQLSAYQCSLHHPSVEL